jgi:two-component system OmpR family response regulator
MNPRPSILVVEANPHLRTAVRRLLEARGYPIVAVESTRDAIAVLDTVAEPIAIAVIDANARDLGTRGLLVRVRSIARRTATLFLADAADDEKVRPLANATGGEVVYKPFRVNELEGVIRAVLARAG